MALNHLFQRGVNTRGKCESIIIRLINISDLMARRREFKYASAVGLNNVSLAKNKTCC